MANMFLLEDDEELKKKKKDDEDEELDDEKDEDKKDDDDDDSSSDGNDYLDDIDSDEDDDDSSSDDDSDSSGNDYLGDEEDSSEDDSDWSDSDEDDYSSNDYLGDDDSSSDSGECCGCGQESGLLAKLAYAIVVATNNFEHVHLMCAGKKFDTIHSMTDNLVGKCWYLIDVAAELALEDEACELDNFCNAAKYVPEMGVETEKTYDYETACTAVSETLRKLIDVTKEARDASDKSHVQSKLDEWLATFNKEYNFLMKRRMKNVDESAVVTNDYI
jgi:DNA-binding ferritin-like protein